MAPSELARPLGASSEEAPQDLAGRSAPGFRQEITPRIPPGNHPQDLARRLPLQRRSRFPRSLKASEGEGSRRERIEERAGGSRRRKREDGGEEGSRRIEEDRGR